MKPQDSISTTFFKLTHIFWGKKDEYTQHKKSGHLFCLSIELSLIKEAEVKQDHKSKSVWNYSL